MARQRTASIHAPMSTDGGSRRQIIKTAAWAAPVATVATAAPAIAASQCEDVTFVAPAPVGNGPSNANARTTSFTVPPNVTSITFEVIGGAGGGATSYGACRPARAVGALAVTPGETLTLTVGQGGFKPSAQSGDTGAAGGGGYGSGGNSAYTPTQGSGQNTIVASGSGGGGSAILSGTTPLVVATGGAGQGQLIHTRPSGTPAFNFTNVGTNFNTIQQGDLGRTIWAANGRSASGGSRGGQGVLNGSVTQGNADFDNEVLGQFGVTSPGGRGGHGVSSWVEFNNHAGNLIRLHVSSGGGGGGYAGGGSGGLSQARWNSAPQTLVTAGGDGGRGSSYTGHSRVSGGSSAPVNGRAGHDQRSPGSIVLTYTLCP